MKTRPIFLLLFAALGRFAMAESGKNEIPPEVLKALHAPDKVTLYSLEPWEQPTDKDEKLAQYKVLGKAELDTKQTVIAVREFEAAVTGWNGGTMLCFDPRQALRVNAGKHTYDLLLCYSCNQLYIYRDGGSLVELGVHGSSKVLKELLTNLKVPLSKTEDTEEEIAARIKKSEADRVKWVEGMPESIKPLWNWEKETNGLTLSTEASRTFRAALNEEYPDKTRRILALFRWFGSGTSWTDYGSYELVPEYLLLELETPDLIAAAQQTDLTQPQLEGAARFFAMTFPRDRPDDIKNLPADLKKKLLGHSLGSNDEDKVARAKDFFE